MGISMSELPKQIASLEASLVDDYVVFVGRTLSEMGNVATLQAFKASILGKKSDLAQLSKQLGGLSDEDKKTYGGLLHVLKTQVQTLFDERLSAIQEEALQLKLAKEAVDVTLPARTQGVGNLHPISQTAWRMQRFFVQAGFVSVTGPEVETDYYNFEALNIPKTHPARAMHDTFYFDAAHLLRTHTSGVQIRTMQQQKAPLRITTVGRVYRCDSDQTHSPMFHQMEGLCVDKDICFAEVKSLIELFLQRFFGKKLTVRFRPSFFPFTEPSAEVDILAENGKWLEVMGCGMVHPKVLENCGVDSEVYQGFAFGMGVERFAMLYYGVSDLRLFFQNDVRFLRQFG